MTKKNETLWIRAAAGGSEFIQYVEASNQPASLSKVDGVAYSGGPIRQPWSSLDMVVDLAGMLFSPQTPLLYSHTNWPSCRLGEVTAAVAANALTVAGGIDPETEFGKTVVDSGKKVQWQLSIGAEVLETERVPEGESRTVNGRSFVGPFLHVTKSRLREVSVVAVGADPETHLRIAASLNIHAHQPQNKGVPMKKELRAFLLAKYSLGAETDDAAIMAHLAKINSTVEAEEADLALKASRKPEGSHAPVSQANAPALTLDQVQAAAKQAADQAIIDAREAETARITGINAAASEYPDLCRKAVSAGWSVADTTKAVEGIKAYASKLPQATGNIIMRSGPAIDEKAIEAALSFRMGIDEKSIEASCGAAAIEAGDKIRGMSLKDIMIEACRIEGKTISIGFDNDTIRAAFSTVSLPGILNNVANKKALQAYTAYPIIATQLCSVGDLSDFKEAERYRLTDVGDLEQVGPDGHLKESGLTEEKATNQLRTYGKIFTLTREMIYNDDLNEFMKIPTAMGNRAARKVDQLFFARLLSNPVQADGKALFSTDHNNYFGGATSALGVDSQEKAIAKFLDQIDADGQPISVSPKFLLVPTVLYPIAQRLTMSAVLFGGTEVAPANNVISNYNLKPVASPYLTNAKYAGNSDTGYYLFGDPNQVETFEIGYFQGRRVPTVERGDTDFTTLGMSFRVYFDVGVREQGHRGIVHSKGKA